MKSSTCENCIKHKTIYCPNSDKCLAREDKPFYEDKYTILTKNEALEGVLEDYTKIIQQLKIQISVREEEYKKLEDTNKVLSQELTKDKILKQDHLTTCCGIPIGDIPKLIEKNRKLEQENQQLKMIIEEYERLNKENGRGFTITSVKQYNIDELIKCEENWNELKEFAKDNLYFYSCYYEADYITIQKNDSIQDVLNKMKRLEKNK